MKKWIAVAIVVIIAVIIAALLLGGKKNNNQTAKSNQNSTASQTKSTTQTSTPSAIATDKVSINNFAFSPADISVKKGTTVTWTNNDSVAHTVTVDSGNGPNSQQLATGQSYSFTFNTVGTITYHCSIHPDMHGSVTVTD